MSKLSGVVMEASTVIVRRFSGIEAKQIYFYYSQLIRIEFSGFF
jgi:hypothetical protein